MCARPRTRARHAAVLLLQRAVRRAARLRPANECDPLTLEGFGTGTRPFVLVSPHSHVPIAYNPGALRAYFEHTHTRVNPVTRRALDDVELWRLAKATGGEPLAILPAKRAQEEQHQEVLMASERALEACWAAALGDQHPWHFEASSLPGLRRSVDDYAAVDLAGCSAAIGRCLRVMLATPLAEQTPSLPWVVEALLMAQGAMRLYRGA